MNRIESYIDYLIALRDQTAVLKSTQNEAKKALEDLRRNDPTRYNEYKVRHKTSEPKVKCDKEQYIREHPELSVKELRKKAKERLLKNRYGIYLTAYLPSWITEEQVLESVDHFNVGDLITDNGKSVPRETLIKRCITCAIADRRIDENKLRQLVSDLFSIHYHNGMITLKEGYLYESVLRMIYEEATVEELFNVTNEWGISINKLVKLINSKELTVTKEDMIEVRKREAKQRRKERKKLKYQEKATNTQDS